MLLSVFIYLSLFLSHFLWSLQISGVTRVEGGGGGPPRVTPSRGGDTLMKVNIFGVNLQEHWWANDHLERRRGCEWWWRWLERSSSGVASYGALGHVPPKLPTISFLVHFRVNLTAQLSKYCVVCEISWCRCQQLTARLISTALLTKLSHRAAAAPGPKVRRECLMT